MTQSADPSVGLKDSLWQKVISMRLKKGQIDLAWCNFMNAALSPKFPCSMGVLRVLLSEIDQAAISSFGWQPVEEDASGTLSEAELTFETSNPLENLLGRFVTRLPGETYILDAGTIRLLRLYNHFGEPEPRSETARIHGHKFPEFATSTSP